MRFKIRGPPRRRGTSPASDITAALWSIVATQAGTNNNSGGQNQMAYTIPCIKGKLGSTDYYLGTMKAEEIVGMAKPASRLDEWEAFDIEERMQRDLNDKRVKDEIAPYIANDPDRFFGSLVILVYEANVFGFEGFDDLHVDLPLSYKAAKQKMGFLTVEGGQMVALDGQHRLAGLEAVVQRRVQGSFADEVPNDDISVVFISLDGNMPKVRHIFNKVNRYAKATSRGDNIVTSEEDGIAIITRRLLRKGEPLGATRENKLLVNWQSNTLSARSHQWTTISAVYFTVKDIAEYEGFDFNVKSGLRRGSIKPSDDELEEAYARTLEWWNALLAGMDGVRWAITDPTTIPEFRQDDGPHSLLFRPIGIMALVKGMRIAKTRSDSKGHFVSLMALVERANRIDWRIRIDSGVNPLWVETIIRADGRMSATTESVAVAAELIAYLVGKDYMDDGEINFFRRRYNLLKGKADIDDETDLGPELPPAVPETVTV